MNYSDASVRYVLKDELCLDLSMMPEYFYTNDNAASYKIVCSLIIT